ncbi:Mitochondrial zinc maintenance protein 1, mitochondrial [Myotisia sp. PD_48]|nr:Mitochondrial zinc maintenance protein 1, mitochondrial [Myotisia sp. PD_48]
MASAPGVTVSALGAYRQLLRATRIAFCGDFRVLDAARAEARKQFDQNRGLGVDTPMKIQDAVEAAQILKTNIVQGTKVESTDENGKPVEKYSTSLLGLYISDYLSKFGIVALRIHEHIERGDNDTIKAAGKTVKVDKPCSG